MTYSRRRWLQSAAGAALGWHLSDGVYAADRPAGKWSWRQLVPHSEKSDRIPVPRDPWNGMLSYKNSLYLFGGAFPRYGPPRGPADLTTLGGLNDLWQFDVKSGRWNQVEADDGLANFDPAAKRPCGRVLPCWVEAGGKFYLFGGLAVTAAGWKTRLLNDLWSFDPATRHWTLLEPDDGRMLDRPTEVDGKRPGTIAAMGTAVIGNRIFVYAGWGGYRNKVVLSPQLWSFDVGSKKWTLHGSGEKSDTWPPKRYCPALTAYKGKLYLWGGVGGAVFSFIFSPQYPVVGASAAVYGVLLGFAMFWPRERVYIWRHGRVCDGFCVAELVFCVWSRVWRREWRGWREREPECWRRRARGV